MGSLWAGIPRTPATPGQGWTGCASRPLLGGGAVWGIVWPRFPVWAPPLPRAWTESSAGASSGTEGPSPGLWQACSWKPTGPGGAGQLSAAKKPQCLTIRPAPHSPLLVTWCFLFRVEDRPAELREAGEPAQATWPVAAPHSAGLLLPSCALGPLRPHWPRPSPLVDRTEVRAPAWRPRYDRCLPPSPGTGAAEVAGEAGEGNTAWGALGQGRSRVGANSRNRACCCFFHGSWAVPAPPP